MHLASLSLVIGGAASGKSAWAEGLVHQSGLAKVYLATAQAWDDEMRAKIEDHRLRRAGQGWRTIEPDGPTACCAALAELEPEEVVLFDCATLWLGMAIEAETDIEAETTQLLEVMRQTPAPVVVVTNELGQGIVPADPQTRRFRDLHGRMNQKIASAADLVVQVTAGLPLGLKGTLP